MKYFDITFQDIRQHLADDSEQKVFSTGKTYKHHLTVERGAAG